MGLSLLRVALTVIGQLSILLIAVSPNPEGSPNENPNTQYAPNGQVSMQYIKYAITFIITIVAGGWHQYQHQDAPTLYEWFLLMLLVFFSLMRLSSFYYLGKFFTYNLCVQKDHKLITEGPYKYWIHPSYVGQIGAIFTFLLLFKVYVLIPPLAIYSYKLVITRIAIEEAMMLKHFSDEYITYKQNRWYVLPYIDNHLNEFFVLVSIIICVLMYVKF